MKKIFIFWAILTLMTGFNCANASDCTFQCADPYDLSHSASRFMSTVTGSNFLAKKVAQMIIKKEVKKVANGDFKVFIDSYSVKDLKKGIFKDFSLQGKNVDIEGITFSELKVKSLCKFNYISQKNKSETVFMEDFPVAFEAVFSETDVNNVIQTKAYQEILDNVNKLFSSTGLFKVSSSKVKIKQDKLYYILNVSIPFIKNVQDIVITTDLNVKNGQIDFTNTKLINSRATVDLKSIDKIINYLNPLDFSLDILENKGANLTVKEVKIIDNKIYTNGFIVIPKDEV